jgi:hypothetical protein
MKEGLEGVKSVAARSRYFCILCKGIKIDMDDYRWEIAYRSLL